jgi:hypothetical protein
VSICNRERDPRFPFAFGRGFSVPGCLARTQAPSAASSRSQLVLRWTRTGPYSIAQLDENSVRTGPWGEARYLRGDEATSPWRTLVAHCQEECKLSLFPLPPSLFPRGGPIHSQFISGLHFICVFIVLPQARLASCPQPAYFASSRNRLSIARPPHYVIRNPLPWHPPPPTPERTAACVSAGMEGRGRGRRRATGKKIRGMMITIS